MRVPKEAFDRELDQIKHQTGVQTDAGLPTAALRELIERYKDVIQKHTRQAFPQDARRQVTMAIQAVFQSWNNERARHYRRIHDMGEDSGTAVTVQAMVFGNCGDTSGTGVGFTRDPSTGERQLFGEFLSNAQGEDIVAGIRTPMPFREMADRMPETYLRLERIVHRPERHFHDVQDFEFTGNRANCFSCRRDPPSEALWLERASRSRWRRKD